MTLPHRMQFTIKLIESTWNISIPQRTSFLVYLTSSPRLSPKMHCTSTPMIFTPGLTTLALLTLTYGYTAQNHLYMKVWRKNNWTKHILCGLHTNKLLTTLLTNLVLLYIKEFFTWNTTIHIHSDTSPLVHKLSSFSTSPPPLVVLPLIVFVTALLIHFPGPLPCILYLIIFVPILLIA